MKHLKLFENFQDIDSICRKLDINNWTQNPDGTIDVDGNVYINGIGLKELPLKFGKVSGNFSCSFNKLTGLEGAPSEVGGYFYCHFNKLTTLEGSPKEVSGDFVCHDNKLTNLDGGPKEVGGEFNCSFNKLTNLDGGPKEVGGEFNCSVNKLITLKGSPNKVGGGFHCHENNLITLEGGPKEVGGDFVCISNPIFQVYKLFPNYKSFMDSLDYNYLRGRNIDRRRFEEALEEMGGELPDRIKGYKYI